MVYYSMLNRERILKLILNQIDFTEEEADRFLRKIELINDDVLVSYSGDYYCCGNIIYDMDNNIVCETETASYAICEDWVEGTNIFYEGANGVFPQNNYINIYDIDRGYYLYIEFEGKFEADEVDYEENILIIHLRERMDSGKKIDMLLDMETYDIINPRGTVRKTVDGEEVFKIKKLEI